MGGAIWVESAAGRGQHVPVRRCRLTDRSDAPAPAAPAAYVREPRPRLRVLLAEDNRVNQRVARRMLERLGHQVVVVENGRAARCRAATREPFDVVLMDVQMPEMDGLEATRRFARSKPGAARTSRSWR